MDYITNEEAGHELMGNDYQDIYLHQQARKLMLAIDIKYNRNSNISLDEYLAEYFEQLTKDEKDQIINLLEKF